MKIGVSRIKGMLSHQILLARLARSIELLIETTFVINYPERKRSTGPGFGLYEWVCHVACNMTCK